MADPEDDNKPAILRVFSDTAGQVYMIYEPLNLRVKVERPVSHETLDKARKELYDLGKAKEKELLLRIEGADDTPLDDQQAANREIKAVLVPAPIGFFKYVQRLAKSLRQVGAAALTAFFLIGLVTRGVVLSADRLPEILHLIVLFLYAIGITMCVYLMATVQNRREKLDRIEWLFGPYGLLILPSLTLFTSATVFGYLTFFFYRHGLVAIQPCNRPAVVPGGLVDFYMWHFLKLVPLLRLNEVLKVGEPLCYTQARVGLLILLFQASVVLPSISTVRFYFKHRRSLTARKYEYIYKPTE
jgi:hypothetical protein